MTRILAQYVSLATAALGLLELILSFIIIEAFFALVGGLPLPAVSPAMLDLDLTGLAALFALITACVGITIGLYRPQVCRERHRLVGNAAVASVIAFPILLLAGAGLHIGVTGRVMFWLAMLLVAWQAGILLTHFAFSTILGSAGKMRRLLVLSAEHPASRLVERLRKSDENLFEPISAAELHSLSSAELRRRGIWGIVVPDHAASIGDPAVLLDSKLRGTRVLSIASFYERHLGRLDLDSVDAQWLLRAEGFVQGRLAAAVKRGLDIVVSLILLLLTLPVMLVTALLVRFESSGPVLYRQERVGLHGQTFTLLKFRSMRLDAEAGGKPRWAQQRDPRITRVGRIIRPLRIDELPQLINVLMGQMSMVGPRPERPHFVEELSRVIPLFQQRAYVKPGLTGWAQVNYPYGASVEDAREKLSYDLYYVKNRNLLLDLLTLFATVRVILSREGAR